MTTLDDMKAVLRETLEARGALLPVKARIRAEIFKALDDQDETKPQLSNTNLFVNELIREYLEFNRYRYTNSVFLPESGQPEDPPFNREFLAKQLHIPETEHSVRIPLLYSIVALLQSGTPAVESKIPPLSFSSSSSSELPPFPPLSQAHLNASAVSHLPTSNFSQAAEPFVSSMQYTSSIGPQTNAHPSSMSSATETSKISALDADNREVPDVLLRRPSFGTFGTTTALQDDSKLIVLSRQ